MNSKNFILILGIFSFSMLSTGCRESNSQANLNDGSSIDRTAIKEAMSTNEVGSGESVDTSEAEAILKSNVETPEVSFNDVYFNLSGSGSTATKSQKVNFNRCVIDFNDPSALALMADQAVSTFANFPYYIQTCSSGDFFVYSAPLNLDHFHLMYGHDNYCFGPSPYVGIGTPANCTSQKQAKDWPRSAMNMNDNTGIKFYAKNRINGKANFDLQGIKVLSGSIEVWVYRTDVKKWWVWRDLKVGSWYWTKNNTDLSDIYIYDNGQNGTYEIDNLEVDLPAGY